MHRKIKMYLLMAAFVFLAGCSKENRNVTETNNRIQKPQESLESQQAGEENQEEQETQEDQEEQRKIEKVTALETNVSMDGWNELDNSETEDENDKEEKDDEKKELLTLDRVLELSRKENWSGRILTAILMRMLVLDCIFICTILMQIFTSLLAEQEGENRCMYIWFPQKKKKNLLIL